MFLNSLWRAAYQPLEFSLSDSPMVDNLYSLVGRLYESDPGFEMEENISNKSVNYRRKSGRLGRSFTFKKSSRSLEALPTTANT